MPIRARDTVVIAAPLFHAWGLVHMGVGLGMSSTAVLQPQFDPEATLAAIAEHRANGLVVVPVMLQRILALGGETIARYDTSSLRYIASSGSALGATLATAAIRRFGPILYNIYGSTEVSLATIAGPDDLQAAPSTAGRPAPGSVVRILDADGKPLGGRPGRAGLRRQPVPVRRLHRRRQQGEHRRAAVERRPRALRRARAGCSSTVATTT